MFLPKSAAVVPILVALASALIVVVAAAAESSASPSAAAAAAAPPSFGVCRGGDAEARSRVLRDIRGADLPTPRDGNDDDGEASAAASAFSEAVGETVPGAGGEDRGAEARRFFEALSSSSAFVREYWHKRPLLIRASDYAGDTGGCGGCGDDDDDAGSSASAPSSWADGAFTVGRDLKLVGGSYVTGHRTSDALRDGTKTDTWDFRPIKDDASRQTTWDDVEQSLRPDGSGGTIYFNTAGSLWPSLAALCRLAGSPTAFGLPVNVNVYVTPPGTTTSVPPHTDRQDVLAIQTEGAKRWRVYGPPHPRKKGVDPLNRGKGGDVISEEELGPTPLIDAVVKRGDVLYVPAGFPHTTDTCTVVPEGSDERGGEEKEEDVFRETSVHLTLGLDTHVWGLTYAHMRWSALQRAGKPFQIRIENDEDYWNSLETIPCGFLARGMSEEETIDEAVSGLKSVMVRMEPDRWRGSDDSEGSEGREDLPSDEELAMVARYMLHDHLGALMKLQREDMFSGVVDPRGEETLLKAYRCTQEQNKIMEKFGAFSKNEAMRKSFEANRLQREALTEGAGAS